MEWEPLGRSEERLDWAFVLSLTGGALIVAGALMPTMGAMSWGGPEHMGEMMGEWRAGDAFGWSWRALLPWSLWSAVAGAVVVVAAAQLRADPARSRTWGAVVVAAGALSLVGMGMGGFLVGALAAVVGGAIALTVESPAPPVREA